MGFGPIRQMPSQSLVSPENAKPSSQSSASNDRSIYSFKLESTTSHPSLQDEAERCEDKTTEAFKLASLCIVGKSLASEG
eukprot:scaffold16490_cov113-Cylindrotheca_fusiformis.AAC.1